MRIFIAILFAVAAHAEEPPPPPPERAELSRLLRSLPTLKGLDLETLGDANVRLQGRAHLRCPFTGHIVVATFDDTAPLACLLSEQRDSLCARAPGARHAWTAEALTALCSPGNAPVTTPAWIASLSALLREDAPHMLTDLSVFDHGDAIRARFLDDDHDIDRARYHVALRGPNGWRLAEQPFIDCLHPENGPWWVLDATKLAGERAWALIATCGGSEGGDGGSFETMLRVVSERDEMFPSLAERRIALRAWLRHDEEDRLVPSFFKRPYVEVILMPRLLGDGTLRLKVARKSLERLPRFCSRAEIRADSVDESAWCPLPELTEVRNSAGTWRLNAGAWVRAQ
jgi:hypothetical protein